ncbi:hypothetical protein [Clostridium saudiense]|uniref:hypothetical protein n=1 Tax=Clostridium saudiense TaxID=1414720 RepID=UPI0018AC6B14|nr:hypothetical protein [Clostridium saudiense]
MKNKIKNMLRNIDYISVIDSLVVVAIIIIVATTIALNVYIGMYLISLILLGLAVIISKYKERE